MDAPVQPRPPRAVRLARACQFGNGVAIALWFPIIIALGHEGTMAAPGVGRGAGTNSWLMGLACVGIGLFAGATFRPAEPHRRPVTSSDEWVRYGAVLSCLGGVLALAVVAIRPPQAWTPSDWTGHDTIIVFMALALLTVAGLNALIFVRHRHDVRDWVDAQAPQLPGPPES